MKIITLTTFSIQNPRTGGAQRVNNIVEFYRSLGHEVLPVGVMEEHAGAVLEGFVPFPPRDELAEVSKELLLLEDLALGKLFANSDHYFAQLKARIPFIPDLIHIEHPWLFGFAKRYAKTLRGRPPFLLYGSANVEHQLKYSLLVDRVSVLKAEQSRDLVLECERDAIKNADGFCCVSEHDLAWASKISRVNVVLAPNGVKARNLTEKGIADANKISRHRKFALYCASAHPPNMNGFFSIFSEGIGCIAPDEALIIVGSAGRHIVNDQRAHRVAGMQGRVVDAGEVDETCIQGLLETANTIILPITSGGGTNLKTAEALWAKKRVVATNIAMRGFETFSTQPGVTVENEPAKFQRAVFDAMNSPVLRLAQSDAKSREQVLWSATLAPLKKLLNLHSAVR
jgi:Glycosyl transferases group 1